MKTYFRILLLSLLVLAPFVVFSAEGDDEILILTGIVKDVESRRGLANAAVVAVAGNIGTVCNSEGVFSLKIPRSQAQQGVAVSYLGYSNVVIPYDEIVKNQGQVVNVWMTQSTLVINDIMVYGGSPREIVERAIDKIADNYADRAHLFSAFYRETVQKRRRYIDISEAFMDVYKTAYRARTVGYDRVRLQKARRLVSQRDRDTISVKVAGGPAMATYIDIIKNSDELLNYEELRNYEFKMEVPISIDDRMQFVISFRPRLETEYPLHIGTLYIDQERLSLTRAEFGLDMSDEDKVVDRILQRRPAGLRFRPMEVSFLVTYKQSGDRTYLNYIRNTMRFSCDWRRRFFSSVYTTTSELVMVDRTDNPETIKARESFHHRAVFGDVVEEYWNEDFWKDYNIIEPTESLESAVDRLKRH